MLKFFRSSANQRLVGRLLKESFRKHAGLYAVAIVAMLVMAGMTAASACPPVMRRVEFDTGWFIVRFPLRVRSAR